MYKTKKNNKTYQNINNNINNTNANASYTKKSQKGGTFVDKGGFGCVVSPALPCPNNDKTLNKNLDKYVSKIIKKYTKETKNEIYMSKYLSILDPYQEYFITLVNKCIIKSFPENRTDLLDITRYKNTKANGSVIRNGNRNGNYNGNVNPNLKLDKSLKKTELQTQSCHIDLDINPTNLIMQNAGYNLFKVMKINQNSKGQNMFLGIMSRLFIENLKIYLKHLLKGLAKMHTNRIVNNDIKPKNIMLLMKTTKQSTFPKNKTKTVYATTPITNTNTINNTKKEYSDTLPYMSIRYIDFGLSQYLTSNNCSYDNINFKGTKLYTSPELFISITIIKYKDKSEDFQLNEIYKDINTNIKKALQIVGELNTQNNISINILINSIYKKIKYQYDKNMFIDAYFGTPSNKYNGYLQKSDIYALGLTIFICLYKFSKMSVESNPKLYDLLIKMIELNPENRFNVMQCLSHEYFR